VTAAPAPSFVTRAGFAERLGRAIQFRTFAAAPPDVTDGAEFDGLIAYLESEFPAVHRQLIREVVGGRTLLFRWRGTDPAVEPILLMSHLDVVPVEAGTEKDWTHPPFSGRIVDGFIWGRGALDVKCGALGLLEAAERLLEAGFRPSGDVYFALGHDEETGGGEGNQRAAAMLRERGVRFRFVLDEGGGLTEGIIDGIDGAVAFVGLAEKGYATIRITARAEGGHASMPPPHTAVGMVSALVTRLESSPFPARIDGATAAMLEFIGPEMKWPMRIALANRWLTGGLVARRFAGKPSLNALIRTTTAATVARGGETANVLPKQAEALVNVRLLPGDSSASVLERVKSVTRGLGLGDDTITCSLEGRVSEPSHVSSIDSAGFRTLQRTIAEVYPGAIVAPGLTMAATDSQYYAPIATDVYRFLPLRLRTEDLARFHGVDERIGVDTYERMIGFLARLIENLTGAGRSVG
jgi:carboxypeptidase PM20D1